MTIEQLERGLKVREAGMGENDGGRRDPREKLGPPRHGKRTSVKRLKTRVKVEEPAPRRHGLIDRAHPWLPRQELLDERVELEPEETILVETLAHDQERLRRFGMEGPDRQDLGVAGGQLVVEAIQHVGLVGEDRVGKVQERPDPLRLELSQQLLEGNRLGNRVAGKEATRPLDELQQPPGRKQVDVAVENQTSPLKKAHLRRWLCSRPKSC